MTSANFFTRADNDSRLQVRHWTLCFGLSAEKLLPPHVRVGKELHWRPEPLAVWFAVQVIVGKRSVRFSQYGPGYASPSLVGTLLLYLPPTYFRAVQSLCHSALPHPHISLIFIGFFQTPNLPHDTDLFWRHTMVSHTLREYILYCCREYDDIFQSYPDHHRKTITRISRCTVGTFPCWDEPQDTCSQCPDCIRKGCNRRMAHTFILPGESFFHLTFNTDNSLSWLSIIYDSWFVPEFVNKLGKPNTYQGLHLQAYLEHGLIQAVLEGVRKFFPELKLDLAVSIHRHNRRQLARFIHLHVYLGNIAQNPSGKLVWISPAVLQEQLCSLAEAWKNTVMDRARNLLPVLVKNLKVPMGRPPDNRFTHPVQQQLLALRRDGRVCMTAINTLLEGADQNMAQQGNHLVHVKPHDGDFEDRLQYLAKRALFALDYDFAWDKVAQTVTWRSCVQPVPELGTFIAILDDLRRPGSHSISSYGLARCRRRLIEVGHEVNSLLEIQNHENAEEVNTNEGT